jgi:cytochrome c peroxidase
MNKRLLTLVFIVFFISVFFACEKDDFKPSIAIISENNGTVEAKDTLVTIKSLGKLLFYDPILSGNRDVACATCHHPDFAYTDGRDLSIGVQAVGLGPKRQFVSGTVSFTERKSMTILNTAFNGMDVKGNFDSTNAPMFWDSRMKSLETQALAPIVSKIEMRGNAYSEAVALDSVVARLRNIAEYRSLFTRVFGGEQPINSTNMAKAIASFERSLTAMNSPFDRYNRGELAAMSALQIQGMNSFQVNGCGRCHSGNMFSDYKLHIMSVPDNPKLLGSDSGSNGNYAFRTMSLRNVKLTAPFMHSGVFKTLDEVLDFYNKILNGKSQNSNVPDSNIDPLASILRPNTNQRAAIIAFINALTDEKFDTKVPKSVPSKLNVGGNIK